MKPANFFSMHFERAIDCGRSTALSVSRQYGRFGGSRIFASMKGAEYDGLA